MNFPAELKYSRDHEWVKMLDDTTALIAYFTDRPPEVSPGEPAYHLFPEVLRKIEHIIPHTQLVRHAPRVRRVVKRAAGVSLGYSCVTVIVQLHGAADALVPGVPEKLRGDAGINAAAHCREYSHFSPRKGVWRDICPPCPPGALR